MDPIENKNTQENKSAFDEAVQKVHSLNAQTKKGAIIALIIFLALVALGVFASRSLPGNALYGLKTQFIETLNESVQFSAENKAQYQVERMKNRLEEVQAFEEKGTFSQKAREDLERVTAKHMETLTSIAAANADAAPSETTLTAINDFAGVALAIESVSERNEALQEFGEFIEDIRRDSVNLYKDEVDRYVERTVPEQIYEFVRAQLSEVSEELNTENINPQTIDDAEVYINRVGPAMAEADYPRAIAAIAEAMRFIQIDIYGAVESEAESPNTDTASSTEESTSTTETQEMPIEAPSGEAASFSFPE